MNNEDKIKELFAEKLGNLEAPVNPELWSAISSQIGTAASVTSTGLSIVAKTIIGISAASVIGVGTYFLTRTTVDEPVKKQEVALEETKNSATNSINVVADTTPFTPDFKEVYVVHTTITCGDIPRSSGEGNDLPYDMGLEPKLPIDLLDNGTFTNAPTPNLIEDRPTEAPKHNTPIVSEQKDSKQDVRQDISPLQTSVQDVAPAKKPSFEITKMPNVCGLNSTGAFAIEYKGECTDFQITIMDSKQNVVFSSNRPDFEWRGTDLSNNQVVPGKYVYIITAKDLNGKAINKYSELTVINQ